MEQNYYDYFFGKKVTVMGLGLLGRGVGDASFIAASGAAEVLVTDLKPKAELSESVARLSGYKNVRFVLGEHRLEDFANRDLILVAAGVPLNSPYLAHARQSGVRLAQSAALFAELSGVPIIGVTGTRGKSTVTHLIHHTLCETTGEPVILGGNVRGVSNLQLLHQAHTGALAVMELDSWQLQGFGWAKRSPKVAVFTSFMEDHLNYYRGDMDAYFADKANIFAYQGDGDVFITTPEVFERVKDFARARGLSFGQEVVLADASVLPDDLPLSLPGAHNRQNAALAYKALVALSLEDDAIFEAFATFPGLPGRLQFVGVYGRGVRVYNDNNATIPAATIVGIEALASGKNVILIMGGSYKDVDPSPLLPAIAKHVKRAYVLPGSGSDRLWEGLENSTYKQKLPIKPVDSLEAALALAMKEGEFGDVLLFSPAFASFGMFKNEYERSDAFMTALRSHKKTP
jgi:UDP-N-acetylmuramoylalanine--D-glutamate ligase